jgi:hypothetical protein
MENPSPRKPRPGSFASFEIAPGGAVHCRKPQWALRMPRQQPRASPGEPEGLARLAAEIMRGLGRKPE